MGDAARMIDWNGTDLPPEMAVLPPGRYRLELVEGTEERDHVVSAETEARILAGRADVAAGRTVSWAEVDAGLKRIIDAHAAR